MIYLGAEANYLNHSFDLYTTTTNKNITSGLLQVSYYFTNLFYISVAMEGFTGAPRTEAVTRNSTYYSFSTSKLKDKVFLPWLLVRYTFRKNKAQEMKERKVLKSYKQGIKL